MRVAIVHDYLNQFGGAEKVVEKWLEMYPEADIYTTVFIQKNFISSPTFEKAGKNGQIHTTWLQQLFSTRFMLKFFKHFFWIYPIVMSFVKVKNYEVVLISSTYCAKNVKLENCKKIIHYCHSPVRFLHGLVTETDHKSLKSIYRIFIPLFTFWLKWMDLRAARYLSSKQAVWIGNSKYIRTLIEQVYKVKAEFIYPPTEIAKFREISRDKFEKTSKSFYLCHGRVSFHKRLDLAIAACLELGRPLVIGGTSSLKKEMDDLQSQVDKYVELHPDSNGLITFLGRTTDEQYFQLLKKCRAFLFPGREDAGIAPIEAFASGVPVIAYKAGGALEYVQDEINGLFFDDQTVESLKEAILKFESKHEALFVADTIKKTSQPFSSEVFEEKFRELINN